MRAYLYALPLTLLIPACTTTPLCGDSFRCSQLTESPIPSEGTGSETDTGTSTDDPTGTGGETSSSGETTTAETTSTGETSTGETATTDESTTAEPSTGETTGGPPLLGLPGTHGEACAPDDGPAVELKIELAARTCDADWAEDVPQLRIVLFKDVAELDLGKHSLNGWGFASYDNGDGTPENSQEGLVVITELTADGLRGTYEVTLPDTTVLSGAFDSLYCPADVLCG